MQTLSSSTGQNKILRKQSQRKNSLFCQQLQSGFFLFNCLTVITLHTLIKESLEIFLNIKQHNDDKLPVHA